MDTEKGPVTVNGHGEIMIDPSSAPHFEQAGLQPSANGRRLLARRRDAHLILKARRSSRHNRVRHARRELARRQMSGSGSDSYGSGSGSYDAYGSGSGYYEDDYMMGTAPKVSAGMTEIDPNAEPPHPLLGMGVTPAPPPMFFHSLSVLYRIPTDPDACRKKLGQQDMNYLGKGSVNYVWKPLVSKMNASIDIFTAAPLWFCVALWFRASH